MVRMAYCFANRVLCSCWRQPCAVSESVTLLYSFFLHNLSFTMNYQDRIFIAFQLSSPKVLVQHGVLCKQGLTFKLRHFASLYFGSGWRNSVGLLVIILYFYFFIGLLFRAGQSTMPCLHKALFVVCNFFKLDALKKRNEGAMLSIGFHSAIINQHLSGQDVCCWTDCINFGL